MFPESPRRRPFRNMPKFSPGWPQVPDLFGKQRFFRNDGPGRGRWDRGGRSGSDGREVGLDRGSIVLDRRRDWTERSRRRSGRESSVGLRRHGSARSGPRSDGRDEAGADRGGDGQKSEPGTEDWSESELADGVDLVDGSWTRPSIVLDRRRLDRGGVGGWAGSRPSHSPPG
ncbi:hypothetical protein TNIN_172431 [Trichonephila inaurata madagascariensis]|uniref:Uncharacterized protein n=1 Tax=Trichonephila inaurata madagascariensis TaxID=2747483 RepID=A0A8X7CS31_9ARAC|nr:hypothetical protein TNIN_172431 [Trichonephila inaurata madagascariensis]